MLVLLKVFAVVTLTLHLPNLFITSIYNHSLSTRSSILTSTMPFIARIKRILKKLSCFHNGDEEATKPITIVSSFYTTLGPLASTLTIAYSHFLTRLLAWHSNVKAIWPFKNLRVVTSEGEACTFQWISTTSSTTRWMKVSIINDSQGPSHKLSTRLHRARFAVRLPQRDVSNPKGHVRKYSKLSQTRRGGPSRSQ